MTVQETLILLRAEHNFASRQYVVAPTRQRREQRDKLKLAIEIREARLMAAHGGLNNGDLEEQ